VLFRAVTSSQPYRRTHNPLIFSPVITRCLKSRHGNCSAAPIFVRHF
jgi:hypothetical protein